MSEEAMKQKPRSNHAIVSLIFFPSDMNSRSEGETMNHPT